MNLLKISDLTEKEILEIFDLADRIRVSSSQSGLTEGIENSDHVIR